MNESGFQAAQPLTGEAQVVDKTSLVHNSFMHIENFFMNELPHRRFNALTGEWVLVSPHRALRPWQGKEEKAIAIFKKSYEPACYLCPGNERVGGQVNPLYKETLVFDNDHPALLPVKNLKQKDNGDDLFQSQCVGGVAKVICFSPRHDLTLADLPLQSLEKVIGAWQQETYELSKTYRWVQVFENKGEMMGCSSPHPHGQIWAMDILPNEAVKELKQQNNYFANHQTSLLLDYALKEQTKKVRVVCENDHWIVVVPYWAVWPFEVLLLPLFSVQTLPALLPEQVQTLAKILKQLLTAYDKLFECSMPYSMGWHQAPADQADDPKWQLHAHFYPPLLRSKHIKKFMVGFEMLAEAQRDLTPEQAAQQLKDCVLF